MDMITMLRQITPANESTNIDTTALRLTVIRSRCIQKGTSTTRNIHIEDTFLLSQARTGHRRTSWVVWITANVRSGRRGGRQQLRHLCVQPETRKDSVRTCCYRIERKAEQHHRSMPHCQTCPEKVAVPVQLVQQGFSLRETFFVLLR